ncbi:MAG: F0F1 ATP synthase subunit A [Candidatus Korobacteraceae bacterium]|jgi:F-type H+-transporting ATPase subunit a
MPEQLWITALLNKYLAGVVNALLGIFHLHATYPRAPIPNYVAMQLVVFVLIILFFVVVRARLSVDDPGKMQHLMEELDSFVTKQSHEVIGHGYEKYVGYLTVLGIFIMLGCLIGVIPGFETATATPSVPLGCAVVTWFYYHLQGVRTNGFSYIKNFLGPVMWLSPLMLLIETASHLARMMSLTIRLYANMFASDLVILVFFSLVPLALPVVFILLHIGVAVIQTYIFVLLATVYIGEAVAHEH